MNRYWQRDLRTGDVSLVEQRSYGDPIPEHVYVAEEGETIANALTKLRNLKTEIWLPAGKITLGDTGTGWKRIGIPVTTTVVVRPMPGVSRKNCVLGYHDGRRRPFRPYNNLRYEDVTFDWAYVSTMNGGCRGFDRCHWTSSLGWEQTGVGSPVVGEYYFHDGSSYDTVFGPIGAKTVRGSRFERISGDVFQHNNDVRDCEIHNVNNRITARHTDIVQRFTKADGILYENIRCTDIAPGTQVFMMESFIGRDVGHPNIVAPEPFAPTHTIRNLTVRNFSVEFVEMDPPSLKNANCNFMGYFEDCLFENVDVRQAWLFRKQFNIGGFRNVVLRNVITENPDAVYPEGVTVEPATV